MYSKSVTSRKARGWQKDTAGFEKHDHLIMLSEVHRNAEQIFSFAEDPGLANETAELREHE